MQRIQARSDVSGERGVAAHVLVPRAAAARVGRGGAHRHRRPAQAHAVCGLVTCHTLNILLIEINARDEDILR